MKYIAIIDENTRITDEFIKKAEEFYKKRK